MRTLVEQTAQESRRWLGNLGLSRSVDVHLLMGGEDAGDWELQPEREAILIGTQDMLLSRALNRGYGMSRYEWPVHFALLNNDCLWVIDETQLMGVGLTTSAQLQGLRQKLCVHGRAQTIWMSATLNAEALNTVDHRPTATGWRTAGLEADDFAQPQVQRLIGAKKPLRAAITRLTSESSKKGYDATLAQEVAKAHRPGTLTLVVVNRVTRAQSVLAAIRRQLAKEGQEADFVFLIHSRFRSNERRPRQAAALDENTIASSGPGRIVVTTQAIEAGVDISATTLFTELAPWSSLVQRFGRSNRRGLCGLEGRPAAEVYWIDIDTSDAGKASEPSLPYTTEQLVVARQHLSSLDDVGPQSLARVTHTEPAAIVHTVRRKDLVDLFDTTPDLAGNDLDVSRYIRDGDDTNVQIYWRQWDLDAEPRAAPPALRDAEGRLRVPAPLRDELCAISIGSAKNFVEKMKPPIAAWTWNALERLWQRVAADELRPGMTLLLHVAAGGYDETLGWTGEPKPEQPATVVDHANDQPPAGMEDDDLGRQPITLVDHVRFVVESAQELECKMEGLLDQRLWEAIGRAARWHDVGKAHPAFQFALHAVAATPLDKQVLWAKSGSRERLAYCMPGANGQRGERRTGFRHELASALAWLKQHDGDPDADLIAYLIAAHHGKVRLSIRSMPNEQPPADPNIKFARGLRDGDPLPQVALMDGETSPAFEIELSLMELGEHDGRPSWLARALALRDDLGPFRLAFLESLVRVADRRGSATPDRSGTPPTREPQP